MRRNSASSLPFAAKAGMEIYDGCYNTALSKPGTVVQSNLQPQRQMQRTILGVISENDQRQRLLSQAAAVTSKAGSGAENVYSLAGKTFSTNAAPVAVQPCFTIYVDDKEDLKENCSFEVEVPSFEETSPMMVDTTFQHPIEDTTDADTEAATVSEYIDEIHQYLREAEIKHRPKPFYMRKQPDITSTMRAILIDWLVEVREEYKLHNETLYLAVNYLDRFLSCMSVLRGKLQLVGTAAILLASKYEEIYPPDVDEFVYITDDTYTKKQLLRMEHLLLKVLAFDLTVPTIIQFLQQYFHKQNVCPKMEYLAMYTAELTLLHVEPFLKYVPSLTAAAAYCLANYTVDRIFWPSTLEAFTGYTLSDIAPCLADLHRACLSAPHQPQQAIREKYKATKYMQVSLLALPQTLLL
ncbi:cyclin-A1 isoform X2 [Pseudophryne corroboree]|uniref:cyclin-A1 isoform X2 n=1 Tax=Pseudophryne corroboree TaxID=495146 RepID=UPI003081EDFC